ncbi:MAG TPA: site-specific integrase, partial [Candidatus Limnocylindria bacterium]
LKVRRSIPTRKYPGGSPFAVRAAAVTLKRLASHLAVDGILADAGGVSVLRHVKRGKVDDDVRRPLSDSESESAINAASKLGPVARAACVLGFGSGLRLNELREARVGDLDLQRGEFHVRPETSKFGKGRTVFLHPAIASDLDRYLRDRNTNREADAPLFPTRSSDPFTEDGFSKLFQRIHRASGLRTFSAHLMRHTWATNFMRVPGASLLELKRQGGWQRWEQVERYSHAVPHHDRRTLPNPLQKTAFGQQPSTRVSRLSVAG